MVKQSNKAISDQSRAKRTGGRPPYEPTEKDRSFVKTMVMARAQHVHIAAVLGITSKTLRKYFRHEIDFGCDKANANVVANLYRQAIKNDPRCISAAIYWTKAQMGWKEREVHEHTGKNGGPIEYYDLSTLSDEELDLLEKLRAKIAKPGGNPGGESA